MDIGKLFNGIAIIVDNEIEDKTSAIYKIKELIEAKNIPVAVFSEVPQLDVIPAFASASFVILDWDYTNKGRLEVEEGERIAIPEALAANEEEQLIAFIKKLLNDVFVPVFVFTAKQPTVVINSLKEAELWDDEKANRIFVKQKTDVASEEDLFTAISEWVKKMPSVYVLKEWEAVIRRAQNSMFNELYSYSPNWAKIIWDMLKEDSRDNQREFGDFVTKQLINRIAGYTFDENTINTDDDVCIEELLSVVEGERYIRCSQPQLQAYTGDLFYEPTTDTYYLNIRAQCDLARTGDPALYLIKGKELSDEDIVTEDIKLTSDQILHLSAKTRYSLTELCEICQNEEELIKVNSLFRAYKNDAFFTNGNIIGKKSEIIIACVAGKKALKFRLDIHQVKKYNQMKDKLIGRILPPYITQIQQSCANHIVREGIMPTPEAIFGSINL